jgi:hypothetical protein
MVRPTWMQSSRSRRDVSKEEYGTLSAYPTPGSHWLS